MPLPLVWGMQADNPREGERKMTQIWTGLAAMVVKEILKIIAPELRDMLKGQLYDLYAKAVKTVGALDDLGVKALIEICGFEVPKVEE